MPESYLDGYSTDGWGIAEGATMPANDMTYTATFTPNIDTPYVVEHYFQQNDGSYKLAENGRVPGSGKTGEKPKVDLLTGLDGYGTGAYDDNLTIAGDGSTVVKVRYDQTALYTATFYAEDETGAKVVIGKSYYYEGKTISVPQSVLDFNPGYRPVWPEDTSFADAPADNTEFTVASWTPAEGTIYTVKHMEQNADDPTLYDVVKTETLDGTTGDPVKVTLIEHNAGEFETGTYNDTLTIDGAGTTVVEVKYDRCVYTLTYDLNAEGDDTAQFVSGVSGTAQMRFGQTITLLTSADVTRYGNALTGWTTDAEGNTPFTDGTTTPAGNLTLYAVWESGVPYKVINILQAVHITGTNYSQASGTIISNHYEDRDYYDEVVEYRVAPTTGQQEIAATVREHFVTPESQSVNILADGTTEVTFEYDRETYNVTVYDVSGATETQLYNGPVRYGTDLTVVQFKFGDKPVMLYTDPACTQEYDPNFGGESIVLYVNEWEGVTYRVELMTSYVGVHHAYEEFGNLWTKLEEQGIKITRSDYCVFLDIQHGTGTKWPEASVLDVPADIKQTTWSYELQANIYEDIPSFDGTFDSLFIGELEVPPVVGGTEFCLVKDRGGTPGVDGEPRMIYSQADLKEIELDVIFGYRNFKLANDIVLTDSRFTSIEDIEDADGGIMLDGGNYTISGFTGNDGAGLFEALPSDSRISDLTLDNFQITDEGDTDAKSGDVGLLVGSVIDSSTGALGSIILDNVTATSSQFRYYREITGGEAVYIGGLIGGCGDAQLQNCTVTDIVVGQHTSRVRGIGAFIGHSTGTTVEIADSCQNGTTYPDVGT